MYFFNFRAFRFVACAILGLSAILTSNTASAGNWQNPKGLNTDAGTDSVEDSLPQLANNGNGVWVAVWSVRVGGAGTENDIRFARSTNDGATWSAPAYLHSSMSSDTRHDWGAPSIATDKNGNWVVVWHAEIPIGFPTDVYFSRSSDNGVTWTSPAILNSNAGDGGYEYNPTIRTDGAGLWMAAWTKDVGGTTGAGDDYDIYYSRSTNLGATWTSIATLNTDFATDTGEDYEPKLATDGSGKWVAVWSGTDISPTNPATRGLMKTATYTTSTNTWSAPKLLEIGGNVGGVTADTDRNGNWLLAYSFRPTTTSLYGTDFDIKLSRTTDPTTTWTAPVAINPSATTDAGVETWPNLSHDAKGNWICTYSTTNTLTGTDVEIGQISSYGDGTTWSAVTFVNNDYSTDSITGVEAYPYTLPGLNGRWVTAWYTNKVLTTTATADVDVWYTYGNAEVDALPSTNAGSWDVDAGALVFPVNIMNVGSTPLTFTGAGVQLTGGVGNFALDTSLTTAPIAADTTRTVLVKFDPSTTGVKNASLVVTTDDLDETTVTIALTATGIDQEIDPSTYALNFPSKDIHAGSPPALSVIVNNIGTNTLAFTGAGLTISGTNADQFQLQPATTSTIAAGGNRTVQVVFNPTSGGAKTANLVITTDDTDEPVLNIALNGTGLDGEITVAPASPIFFGFRDMNAGAGAPLNVSITNDGTGVLSFGGTGIIITGTNASDFAFTSAPVISPLAPTASRSLSIEFDPSAAGPRSATLSITSDDADEGTTLIQLTGNGTPGPTAAHDWTLYN